MEADWLKRLGSGVAILSVVLSFSGCGGAGAEQKIPGYDIGGIAEDVRISRMLPSDVSADGVLTVGSNTTYPPAEFVAEDGRTPVGYEMDLARAVAAVFGLREETVYSPFDSIIPAVGYKFDIGASGITVTQERKPAIDFVTLFASGSSFVTKQGNPSGLDSSDVCGHEIAAQVGTLQEENLRDMAGRCLAQGRPKLRVMSVKMQTDATTAVMTGKAEAFYADTPVAGYAVKQTGDTLQVEGKPIGVVPEAIAVCKGDDATARAVQAAVNKLIDDGTYMRILRYWGVEDGAIKRAEINP